MIWTTSSIFCLILIIGNISAVRHNPKIIGGDRAFVKHFPFIVSFRENGKQICGGSIISDRHILTAAHCCGKSPFVHYKPDELSIHSGTSMRDGEGEVHKVLSIHRHPKYKYFEDDSLLYDICVMTLKEPIIFNKYQQKINLPSHDVQYYQAGYVLGWGNTVTIPIYVPPTHLKKLKVALLPSDKCKPWVKGYINENHVCAFRSDVTGVCHGDSGGPLVSHGEIVGVASQIGENYCASGTPDIYTNVFTCKDFIESVMNDVPM